VRAPEMQGARRLLISGVVEETDAIWTDAPAALGDGATLGRLGDSFVVMWTPTLRRRADG
jgi:hypothetical protein